MGTHSRGDGETMTSPCVCPSIRHVGRDGEREGKEGKSTGEMEMGAEVDWG